MGALPSIRRNGCAPAGSYLAGRRTIAIFPGMTFVQMLIGRAKATMRKAAVVLAATQVMLGTAPLTESDSRSATAHIEAGGIDVHHAHNDSCIACVAHKVLSGADVERRAAHVAVERRVGVSPTRNTFDSRLVNGPTRSRSPPSSVLA